jgi:starch-binding outer membrane protein, SusD/RagB family
MKKIYILAVFTVLFGVSCDKELEQQPNSQLALENFYKTSADALSGVGGIYDALQKSEGNNRFLSYGELRTDNVVRTSTTNGGNAGIIANNLAAETPGTDWASYYTLISRANLAIEKIPSINADVNELLGEALFLRAYAYFQLVKIWGAVPLITSPVLNFDKNTAFLPRTEPTEIFNKVIIPDMLKAESLIGTVARQHRVSKNAALNLQGDVYMWLKQWDKAKIAYGKVETARSYTLVNNETDWSRLFRTEVAGGVATKFNVGTELIFSIKFDVAEDGDRSGIHNVLYAGVPQTFLNPQLDSLWLSTFPRDSLGWVAKFPGVKPIQNTATGLPIYGDYRYNFTRQVGASPVTEAQINKYSAINIAISLSDSDIPVYRYAPMLYNLAECENNLGNIPAAIALCNRIRAARLLPPIISANFTTKERVEDLILSEKRFETIGEAYRFWDLVRAGKALSVLKLSSADKILWPVNNARLSENPMLKQNPGY